VLMHPDERPWIHERLDDRRERAVAVVTVVGDCAAGEIEMNAKLALVLRNIRSWRRVDARVRLC